MPLQLPNLDDRTYDDLVTEALGLISAYAPDWTNYNPSDPGITLIELFAYLTELMIYRLNQVTDETKQGFLNLISATKYTQPLDQATLDTNILRAIQSLRQVDRAVTEADFEQLALQVSGVARAHCVPLRNLESGDAAAFQPGHMSVVIVPQETHQTSTSPSEAPIPQPELLTEVRQYLEPRRLLTTQVHVVAPRYVPIRVRLKLILKPDAVTRSLCQEVIQSLKTFFHPMDGGMDGNGWPFGRNIHVSELYELLDQHPGVDYVEPPPADPTTGQDEVIAGVINRQQRVAGQLTAIALEPDELIDAPINPADITLIRAENPEEPVTCDIVGV